MLGLEGCGSGILIQVEVGSLLRYRGEYELGEGEIEYMGMRGNDVWCVCKVNWYITEYRYTSMSCVLVIYILLLLLFCYSVTD